MSHIRTEFLDSTGNLWVSINPSLHSMCAHSWQLFQICSTPIAVYSEQAQEHWNKFVTLFKSGGGARLRQHSMCAHNWQLFQICSISIVVYTVLPIGDILAKLVATFEAFGCYCSLWPKATIFERSQRPYLRPSAPIVRCGQRPQ